MMTDRLFVRLDEDASHGPESGAPSGSLRSLSVPGSHPQLVSHVLSYCEQLAPGEELVERVLPDGAVRLIYLEDDCSDRKGPRLALAGPTIAPVLVRLHGRVQGLSITLAPGAATVLFGLPAREFVDLTVPLQDLWPREGRDLLDRLVAQREPLSQARILVEALSRRAPGGTIEAIRMAAGAVQAIRSGAAGRRPREVASALGVGERRLQQIFHDHVGLAPKAVSRLARMHDLLRALRRDTSPAWAELAPDLGFYDQAHLANEFRTLSGLTPSQFLARSASGFSKTPG